MFASLVRTFGRKTGGRGPARQPGLRLEALGERAAPASSVGSASGGDCITFAGSVGSTVGNQDYTAPAGDVALCGSGNASGGGIELIVGAGDVSLLSAKPPGSGTTTGG